MIIVLSTLLFPQAQVEMITITRYDNGVRIVDVGISDRQIKTAIAVVLVIVSQSLISLLLRMDCGRRRILRHVNRVRAQFLAERVRHEDYTRGR